MKMKFQTVPKMIIIVGGSGPQAGSVLQNHINRNIKAENDQGHLPVMHMSWPPPGNPNDYVTWLADPEAFEGEIENPGFHFSNVSIAASKYAKSMGVSCVIGVPCNTFHCQPIWDVYEKNVRTWNDENNTRGSSGSIERLFHMPHLLCNLIQEKGYKKVGILCTNSTKRMGLYKTPLEKNGLQCIEVDNNQIIQDCIDSVKKLCYATDEYQAHVMDGLRELKIKGSEAIILGCTEIPVYISETKFEGIEIFDPMLVMAREMIREVDSEKLIEL
jgi:aspartate racemase